MDILIFGGQSNMQGQTESLPEPNEPVENALEYRFEADALIPVAHPVGENLEDGLLLGASSGHGSLIPDFCRAYTKATGRQVVAIHAARGNTKLAEWLKGTERYACALRKIRAGIEKAKTAGTVDRISYIWLQGESDAIERTSEEDYKKMLTAYKNDLKADAGIQRFAMIRVGYFCATVRWLTDRTKEDGKACDEAIMQAQQALAETDADFVLLTDICGKLSLDPRYINPFADGHYNNAAMTVIGTEAGNALAKL